MHGIKNFAIKGLLFPGAIFLFAFSVHAQTGMPKELTCTETAFNFSFSLGSGWKLVAPKMGPVEILSHDADYSPLWRLKVNKMPVPKKLLLFSQTPFAIQKSENLNLLHEPQLLFSKLNFTTPVNYALKPPFQYYPENL